MMVPKTTKYKEVEMTGAIILCNKVRPVLAISNLYMALTA